MVYLYVDVCVCGGGGGGGLLTSTHPKINLSVSKYKDKEGLEGGGSGKKINTTVKSTYQYENSIHVECSVSRLTRIVAVGGIAVGGAVGHSVLHVHSIEKKKNVISGLALEIEISIKYQAKISKVSVSTSEITKFPREKKLSDSDKI